MRLAKKERLNHKKKIYIFFQLNEAYCKSNKKVILMSTVPLEIMRNDA